MGMLVVPVWKAIDEGRRGWDEVSNGNACCHGEEDPESQEAVEKREFLPLEWSAGLALRVGQTGHGYLASCCLASMATGTGGGAPWRAANLAGVQQAFESRARSACMDRSSLSQESVWRRT